MDTKHQNPHNNAVSYQSLSDEKLVPIIIGQDQELYGIIIERYESRLKRYISTYIKEPGTQQDILQKTFIKAFTHLKGFNTKRKFSSWIYRIAHNEALNHISYKKKFIDLSDIEFDILGSIKSKTYLPEETAEREDLQEHVRRCLDKLKLKYKEVLTLYYLEELKYEEISTILGIPTGTVGVRLSRAKEKLKEICIKEGLKYE